MANKERRTKKIKKKLLHKYRLVVLNEDTFEERFSFKLNRLNVFVFGMAFALGLIVITSFIIAFTPLREYIPGYSSTTVKKKAIRLAYESDSLQQVLNVNQQYLASIKKVLTGDVTRVEFNKDSILNAAQEDVSGIPLGASKEDSLLRAEVALEDKYNPLTDAPEDDYALFPPVKGTISEGFDMRQKHYAVDVVTAKNAPVKNIADGTVIFSGWTAGTGFVMIIRHTNQLISVYKHNASLTKEEGDPVKSGEVIATVGNTGELTTGPHLHFELWRNGTPIDPTNFLDFD